MKRNVSERFSQANIQEALEISKFLRPDTLDVNEIEFAVSIFEDANAGGAVSDTDINFLRTLRDRQLLGEQVHTT